MERMLSVCVAGAYMGHVHKRGTHGTVGYVSAEIEGCMTCSVACSAAVSMRLIFEDHPRNSSI